MAILLRRFHSSHSSPLPAKVRDRQRVVKSMEAELRSAKGIIRSWTSTLTRIKASGSLLEQQRMDTELAEMGSSFVNVIAANQVLELFDFAAKSVERKLTMIAHTDEMCSELEKLRHQRDKFMRKKNEQLNKMAKKGLDPRLHTVKYAEEHEQYEWDYQTLLCALVAEYDFFIREGREGICAVEFRFLKDYLKSIFPTCLHAEPLANKIMGIRQYAQNFLKEKEEYVYKRKMQAVQEKGLKEGIVSVAKPRRNGLQVCKASAPDPYASSYSTDGSSGSSTTDSQPVRLTTADSHPVRMTTADSQPVRLENYQRKETIQVQKTDVAKAMNTQASRRPPLQRRISQLEEKNLVQVMDFVDAPALPPKQYKLKQAQPTHEQEDRLQNKQSAPSQVQNKHPEQTQGQNQEHVELKRVEEIGGSRLGKKRLSVVDLSQMGTSSSSVEEDSGAQPVREETQKPNKSFSKARGAPFIRQSIALSTKEFNGRWSQQFNTKALNTPEFEAFRDKMASGFFLGRKDGWEEYVCRETGDSFWLHPGTLTVETSTPPPPFRSTHED